MDQEIRKNLKEAAKWLNSAGKRMDRMSQEIAQREERYAQERAHEREQRAQERTQEREERAKERAQEREEREKESEKWYAKWDQERAQEYEQRAQAQAKQDKLWNIKMNELRQEIKEVNQEIQTVNQERKAANKELNQEIKTVSQMIGGHTQNVGSVTEKHFVNSFEKYPSMGEIHFDLILSNLKIGSRRASHEIDIVMLNGSYCAAVEVKYKCHPHDVTRYRAARGTLLSQLRALFPKEHYIFALASDEFVAEAKHEALGAGLVVVEREGAELKIDASGMELF